MKGSETLNHSREIGQEKAVLEFLNNCRSDSPSSSATSAGCRGPCAESEGQPLRSGGSLLKQSECAVVAQLLKSLQEEVPWEPMHLTL